MEYTFKETMKSKREGEKKVTKVSDKPNTTRESKIKWHCITTPAEGEVT